jgi:hypothetical protein
MWTVGKKDITNFHSTLISMFSFPSSLDRVRLITQCILACCVVALLGGGAAGAIAELPLHIDNATGFIYVTLSAASLHGHPLDLSSDDGPFPLATFLAENTTTSFQSARFLVDMQSARNHFFVSDWRLRRCCETAHPLCRSVVPVKDCPTSYNGNTFWLPYQRQEQGDDPDTARIYREQFTITSACRIGGVARVPFRNRGAEDTTAYIRVLDSMAWSTQLVPYDGVLGLQPRSNAACHTPDNVVFGCTPKPDSCPEPRWAYHVLSLRRSQLLLLDERQELTSVMQGAFGPDTAIHFSETYWGPDRPDKDVYFMVRGVRMCDAEMSVVYGGGSISSIGYLGKVSTLSPCLEVPEEVFEGISAWLNLTCAAPPLHSYAQQLRCKLSDPSKIDFLPPLHIQLKNITVGTASRPANVQWIRINLAALIMPDRESICLLSTGSMAEMVDGVRRYVREPMDDGRMPPAMVFGTMVLPQLSVVSSPSRGVVGLIGRGGTPLLTTSCGARAQCIGSQLYEPRVNTCRDPDCAATLFKEVDPATRECRYKVGFLVAVCAVMATLMGAELVLYRTYALSVFPRLHALAVADRANQHAAHA